MKVSMIEETENHFAFSRENRCPRCNSRRYAIHHLMPEDSWWISCRQCGYETSEQPYEWLANEIWRGIFDDDYEPSVND